MLTGQFEQTHYQVHRQVFKVFGGAFRVFDSTGQLALFADMKAFRLKEDIRLYTGEDKMHEVLSIQARQIIDWSAAYDVYDPATQEKIGALRRRGFRSMIQDEWIILDSQDNEIGTIKEDSLVFALLRRFLTNLIPQSFSGEVRGTGVFEFKQHFNPFWLKLNLDFSMDTQGLLDRRLGIAAAVLLCAIEGRQQ